MNVLRRVSQILLAIYFVNIPLISASATPNTSNYPPAFAGIPHACPTAESKCVVSYFKNVSQGLCYNSVNPVDPKYWKESRKLRMLPHYAESKIRPSELAITKIQFMQDSASGLYTGDKYDIIDTAKALKSGKLKVSELPKIEVWQDEQGRIWTLDHRRLLAMILAGIDRAPVVWADQATVLRNKFEYTTSSDGRKITVWLTDQVGMVITNDGTCKSRVLH